MDSQEHSPRSAMGNLLTVALLAVLFRLHLETFLTLSGNAASAVEPSDGQQVLQGTNTSASVGVIALQDTELDANALADSVREMFSHAYDGYMRHAFPLDDLRPLTLDGSESFAEVGNLDLVGLERNSYSGIALSLLESLSTLAVLGNVTEFISAVEWLQAHPRLFDQNVRVNVFEAMIRPLGALLSAHMLAEYSMPELCTWCGKDFGSPLLALATDLGSRLFPAYAESPSGIPFAWVNLRHGVAENETGETNLAGAGTGILEFALLSRLTGDWRYENASVTCLSKLWSMRSAQGLFGTSIDVRTGAWIDNHASVGFGTDSYFEYLIKGYILLGDPWYWSMFASAYEAIQRHMRSGPWYNDVHMMTGVKLQEAFTSLQAFFPGLQVDVGDLGKAAVSHRAFFDVWEQFGVLPERYLYTTRTAHPSMDYYPLRPELAESTFWLYQATKEPYYQHVVGRTLIDGLNRYSRVESGGFAAIRSVRTMEKENHQQSFLLSEVLKYLYLLYNDTFLRRSSHGFVFTTEGHPLPIVQELRESPLPPQEPAKRYRDWCVGRAARQSILGHRCSCLDLRICPVWEGAGGSKLEPGVLESAVIRSTCHVADMQRESRCDASLACGVDSDTCRQRLCSKEGLCFTPR